MAYDEQVTAAARQRLEQRLTAALDTPAIFAISWMVISSSPAFFYH